MSSAAEAPAAASSSGVKPSRILACVLCQHRKIKCDRTFPCANCVKANVTCTPSTPAPARKRRRPNQDLQERLARCEKLLKEYATAKPESDSPTQTHAQIEERYRNWRPTGRLVVESDGGVRFIDSILVGTVYEELKAMREIVDAEDNEASSPMDSTATPDEHSELIMGGESPKLTLEELQPSPGHIFRLWHMYLERVNPLTKVIHVPTLQPYLVDATNNSPLPKNIEALLFAIYTLATVAMSSDECLNMLGYSKDAALERFSAGTRISLNRLGFLKCHDMETLQALIVYLISLQNRYNRHATWILNGVVIRIAQKMGLHRDGEALGLSPFDTEMRRRVWWQIIMLDAKYALMSGLSHSHLPRGWDTKPPKNINDADLYPAATEPIQDREGPTEMIMIILSNRLARFLVDTPGIEPMMLMSNPESFRGPGAPTKEQIDFYKGYVSELARDMLVLIDRFNDPSAGPLHEMAAEMRDEIIKKVQELISPNRERQFADEVHTPSDNAFSVAVQTTEHGVDQHWRIRRRGFAWYARLHFQLHIFQYMVGQLCFRTAGELVEKAWATVEKAYDLYPDLFDLSHKANYQLATFLLRAWKTREEVLRARLGRAPEPPGCVAKLQVTIPQVDEAKSEPSTNPATDAGTPVSKDAMETDPALDQLLETYLDGNAADWDMWGNMVPAGSAMTAFGGFGMGPSTEW